MFTNWPGVLGSEVLVAPVHLPGHGKRLNEAPIRNLRLLAQKAFEAIQTELRPPFCFLGHSMGALLAFEVARLATSRQILPAYLFVGGAKPPHLRSLSKRTFDLPEPEFLREIRKFNGTPQEVFDSEELLAFMMPMLRSDFEAVETYVLAGAEPLCCPIVAFGGIRDPTVSEEDLRGWGQYTVAEFSYFLLPGDHFFINTVPVQLGTKLRALLRTINR